MSERVYFRLAIDAEELLRLYRGEAEDVVVTAADGRVIRFPARHLRAHVTQDGVYGWFCLRFDANYRLIALERQRD